MFRAEIIPTILALALGACASSRARVPLVGGAGDVSALTGEWAGDYSSAESGRSGSISFTLRAAGDTAFGDVVMIPRGYGQPLTPYRGANATPEGRPQSEVLTINFVRVEGGKVTGTLAPYADPETGARLMTTFAGDLTGATIEGTYTTRLPSGQTQQGRWTVRRR